MQGSSKTRQTPGFISTVPFPLQSLPHTRIHVEGEEYLGSHSLQPFLQGRVSWGEQTPGVILDRKLHDEPGRGCLHQTRTRSVFCCITLTCFISEGCHSWCLGLHHSFEIIVNKVENNSPGITFTSRGQYQRSAKYKSSRCTNQRQYFITRACVQRYFQASATTCNESLTTSRGSEHWLQAYQGD